MSQCKSRASLFIMIALVAGAASATAEAPRLDLVWVDPTDIASSRGRGVARPARGDGGGGDVDGRALRGGGRPGIPGRDCGTDLFARSQP